MTWFRCIKGNANKRNSVNRDTVPGAFVTGFQSQNGKEQDGTLEVMP